MLGIVFLREVGDVPPAKLGPITYSVDNLHAFLVGK